MADLSVKIVPFPVPTGVSIRQAPGRRQDGFRPLPQVNLTDLSPEVLDQLCEEFRASVFEAAGYNPAFKRPELQLIDEANRVR